MSQSNKKNKSRKSAKKGRKKTQSNLSKILNSSKKTVFRSTEEKAAFVRNAFFNDLRPIEIVKGFEKIAGHPFFSASVKLTKSKDYESVYTLITPSAGLMACMAWCVGLVIHYQEIINRFVRLECSLTELILDEDYNDAIKVLDEIDSICGFSTWSLGIRGSILELAGRHDEVQKYLSEVYEKCGNNEFFKAICRHRMDRYDDSVLVITEGGAQREQLSRSFHGGLDDLLIYKIAPKDFVYEKDVNYENIFNYEKNSSIIDIYKLVINAISSGFDSQRVELNKASLFAVRNLSPYISSDIIDGACMHFGIEVEWNVYESDYKMLDSYTSGRYEEVCEFEDRIERAMTFSHFELISKSAIRSDKDVFSDLKNRIFTDLKIIYLKSGSYHSSLNKLLALCHAFADVPWFQELHFLVSRESGYIAGKSHSLLNNLSVIYSSVNSPKKIGVAESGLREKLFEKSRNAIGDSVSIDLFQVCNSGDINDLERSEFSEVAKCRFLKYKSYLLLKKGYINEAIALLMSLSQDADKIASYDATVQLVKAYIDTEKPIMALQIFVDFVLLNNNLVYMFDTYTIWEAGRKVIVETCSLVALIALSLHSRFVDDKQDSTLRFGLDKYMTQMGFSHPLDITKFPDISDNIIYYFLEHVCTRDIMKLCFMFEDTKSIEDARIDICAYLIEKEISKKQMANEIKGITKEHVIRKAAKYVDQSRIHVDLASFRGDGSRVFRAIYAIYNKLNENDYSATNDEKLLNQVNDYISTGSTNIQEYDDLIYVAGLNEKNATFHKLLKLLREEFIYGHKGLNIYLSTRIRHGVLAGKLRPCAAKEMLVTPIDEITKKPKENLYWKNKLSSISDDEWKHINSSLSKFTQDFTKIINLINDDWLQVVSLDRDIKSLQNNNEVGKALFNYTISHAESFILQTITTGSDYDGFVRQAIDWLWKKTNINLDSVKKNLNEKAVLLFSECHSGLIDDINKINNDERFSGLLDAVSRSKDSISSVLLLVSSWFTCTTGDIIDEFDIETAVEIASSPANAEVTCKIVGQHVSFNGVYLTSLVDILYILFDNAVIKSNLDKRDLKIDVVLEFNDDDTMLLSVLNTCKSIGNVELANKSLDYYRTAYGNDDMIGNNDQGEGGSGFFKIWRVLSKEFEVDHVFEFGYNTPESFLACIAIDKPLGIFFDEVITG